MYEKYSHLCISAFCISVLFYIFTPEKGMKVYVPEVSAKEVQTATGKTTSGVSMEIPDRGKEDSKKESHSGTSRTGSKIVQGVHENCDAECKVKTLIKLGMNDKIAGSLVYTCKDKAKDPRHCIIAGASILKAESNFGKKCNGNNCFGMGGGRFKYDTLEKGVEDWVIRYSKFWTKAKSAGHFYPPKGGVAPSRYCTSEHSSNSPVGCPNGRKHASYIWNKLDSNF